MPHFSVSWNRAIATLCPQWLEALVNEDETRDSGLDVEMSLRYIEDLPLQPLPPGLVSSEEQGFNDLSLAEISAIEEATFDFSPTLEVSENHIKESQDSSPMLMFCRVPSNSKLRNCSDRHDEMDR
ncbi:hypothetical protein RRF57_005402 [Xylaria bambusicola]|uniref:Uncharacterized protein n=1 Tax=Xylaria bambusicola TaxID=326684 RepID=A0AAN7Z4R4_9PEZI